MEMRLLTRSLRARPTTLSLLTHKPLLNTQAIRFNSSDSNRNPTPPPTETQAPARPPASRGSYQFIPGGGGPPRTRGQAYDSLFKTARSPAVRRARQPLRSPSPSESGPRVSSEFDSIIEGLKTAENRRVSAHGENVAMYRENLKLQQKKKTKPDLKLDSTLGRQVGVNFRMGVTVHQAIGRLNATLSSNGVKQQAYAQKFHVRKGQLRKQLKVKRWRSLFKKSFQSTVQKIQRMQAQGW
ncbi:hypothetical protein BJY04DRAFT_190735 [Aspergillus karnatakaensis]|uniref:mitochondrial 37S ribosomal protein bS21m n=1 Tax=Aspergillus karnatakaensis TaxID=1810916 RepID=UPI003CCDFD76